MDLSPLRDLPDRWRDEARTLRLYERYAAPRAARKSPGSSASSETRTVEPRSGLNTPMKTLKTPLQGVQPGNPRHSGTTEHPEYDQQRVLEGGQVRSNLQRREIVVGSGHSAGERGISHVCPNCGGGMGAGEDLCGSCRYVRDERLGIQQAAY